MKLKIKVKVLTGGCMPVISENGDWIDLSSAINITIPAPQADVLKRKTVEGERVGHRDVKIPTYYIPLGVVTHIMAMMTSGTMYVLL